jgi:hypothetical protein
MPNKFPWTKSNRSHQSVDNSSSGQPSPVPSGKGAFDPPTVRAADEQALAVNEQVAAQRYQPSDGQQAPVQTQQSPVQQQSPGVPQAQYREQFPQRTTSHRLSAHLPLGQSSQNYQQQPGQPSPALESPRRGSYQPQPSPVAYTQEPPKKQSLRSRIAAGVKGHKDQEAKAQKNGLGRKVSVRKSDPRIQGYQSQEDVRWHQNQGSSLHLPPSNEQDEDNLDPFLQQESRDSPQVPPKDIQYQNLQQPQHFAPPQPHQEQYNRPPLGRVSTEESYSTQGGVDQYSPDRQGQGLQQPQQQTGQQQQYQGFPPSAQHPPSSNDYQVFNAQNAPSPLLQNAQLHGQGGQAQDVQQNYYQYQQQQDPQLLQGQSVLDNPQQSVHYPQQQHFAPQPQPHQDLQPPTTRPPSQQQTELQHPQATRLPQIVQQNKQVDLQQSQQRRPPSSHQLAPPSPLQPPSYQTHDAPQGNNAQPSDLHPSNITLPQQGQNNMAPSAQSNARNTLRKVNEGSQPQPGAPSRESSLLTQPPAQGQTLGQPPVSPGLATFDANVVPTASQGQPYRGEKTSQQVSEMDRATPPLRSNAPDMSDEDIEKMMKEHDVLRE